MKRIAIRCDGGSHAGAGHVARCLPIAEALVSMGCKVRFIGEFDGFAEWLLGQHGMASQPPAGAPCGVRPDDWSGAIVDLYLPGPGAQREICALAAVLPIATPGEASRCRGSGVWIDYHLNAAPSSEPSRLAGSRYVPVDPRFRAAFRPRPDVQRVLVTVGGSDRFDGFAADLAREVTLAFPDATVLARPAVAELAGSHVRALPANVELAGVAIDIDLAVTAGGFTAYELPSAGIPTLAVGVVANQRVVLESCRATGIALTVDAIESRAVEATRAALVALRDPDERARLSANGRHTIDGRGAERVAAALAAAWL